jgi:transposase
MKPQSPLEVVELDVEQLEAKLRRIEEEMGEETARPFRMLLSWYLSLLRLIQQKNTSIARLRRLLFGARTERTRDIFNHEEANAEPPTNPAVDPPEDSNDASARPAEGG